MGHNDETAGILTEAAGESGYSARTMVLDFANNWGGGYLGIRSVDTFLAGVKNGIVDADVAGYYSTIYPPPPYWYFHPEYAFITALSKTGTHLYTSYCGAAGVVTNVRIIGVFAAEINFDEIIINNWHVSGAFTNYGVKDTKIYVAPGVYTNTTYGAAVTDGQLVFDGQISAHVSADVVDDQTLTLI